MSTLGERIRKLRKQKKMTLETLAGEGLTKGMLSLIENNKANPSMESLSFIAERLEIEVAELLEEVSSQELRVVLEEAEKLYNIEFENLTDEFKRLIALVEPYVPKLMQGYESARLLEMYSRCLYHEKLDGWQEPSDRAALIFEKMNLTARRASIGMFRAMVQFTEHNYMQSLKILLQERAEVESKSAYMDPMTRVDFDYHEAILHFAVGDVDAAIDVMEKAIDYSKRHGIFYRVDALYRLAAAHAMMSKDEEKRGYYLEKLRLYGEFAEDTHANLFNDLMIIENLIFMEHKYSRALEMIDKHLMESNMGEVYSPWLCLGKGKALYYLKRYDEALHWLEKGKIPPYMHHPFDLSIFYVMDSYKALCYMKLGNKEEAIISAELAVKNINPLPHTPYKDFIFETYDEVKREM